MVMSTLCGENLLENRVMVYFPGASPTVLKSNSFSPFLLSQWNLFASSLSRSGGKKKFPLLLGLDTGEGAAFFPGGGPEQLPPLDNEKRREKSITFYLCGAECLILGRGHEAEGVAGLAEGLVEGNHAR